MEYSELLNRAADASTPEEALCFLAALAVSAYATTSCRTSEKFSHQVYFLKSSSFSHHSMMFIASVFNPLFPR